MTSHHPYWCLPRGQSMNNLSALCLRLFVPQIAQSTNYRPRSLAQIGRNIYIRKTLERILCYCEKRAWCEISGSARLVITRGTYVICKKAALCGFGGARGTGRSLTNGFGTINSRAFIAISAHRSGVVLILSRVRSRLWGRKCLPQACNLHRGHF